MAEKHAGDYTPRGGASREDHADHRRVHAGGTPPPSKSRISRILNRCAVLEEYETASGYAGKSLNFHDGKSGKWHQVWIDSGHWETCKNTGRTWETAFDGLYTPRAGSAAR